MFNKIKEIEKKYPEITNLQYKGEQIWPYLRISYYWESLVTITSPRDKSTKNIFIKQLYKHVKSAFYGFKYWFSSYDYFVLGDASKRHKIDGVYIDKCFEKIMESIGYEKVLYFNSTSSRYLKKNEVKTPNIVSMIGLQGSIYVLAKCINFIKRNKTIYKELNGIQEDMNIYINYAFYIHKFNISVVIYKILLKIYRPKIIFIDCYYSHMSFIKAANELNIKTIEMQHGQIGDSHFAYNIYVNVDKAFYPNLLLTFGEHDKQLLENNQYNPFLKIIAVGAYQLELLEQKALVQELLNITTKYKYSISVSTQYTVENELAEFIKKVATERSDVAFLLSLRQYNKEYYDKFSMPKNVYFFKEEYSCYDILKVCDTHLTVYSTCAMEALFFQKKSILFDIHGFCTSSIRDIESNNVYIVSTINEFNDIIGLNFVEEIDTVYKCAYIENIFHVITEEILSI